MTEQMQNMGSEFNRVRLRTRKTAQGLREIAEPYLELLDLAEGMTIQEWLARVEMLDPEVAEQIRNYDKRDAQSYIDPQRQAAVEEAEESDRWFTNFDSGIPTTTETFENFKKSRSKSVADAYQAVREWSREIGPPILTLAGFPGVGKTHLAIAAAKFLQANDRIVIFRTEADLLAERRQYIGNGGNRAETFIDELMHVPSLIIDELGGDVQTEASKALMDRIISNRWRERMRLLITTNLLAKDMPPRLASRLQDAEVSRVVAITAADYRQNRK